MSSGPLPDDPFMPTAFREDFPLQFALQVSRLGAWDLNLIDHTVTRTLEHDRIFGYEELQPEWTLERFVEHVVPEDREMVNAKVHAAVATGGDWDFECRIRRADGEIRWIWVAGRRRVDAAGTPIRMAGVVQDITDRMRAEEALQESTALLRAISDNSTAVIFAKDTDGRIRFANPATLALLGKSLAETLGRTDEELLAHKEAGRQVRENDRRVMETGVPMEVEEHVPWPDGTPGVWLARKAPFRDVDGRVIGVLGISTDITGRKKTEQALNHAIQQLAESDRRKDEFIAVLSHELRNPLAPIRFALPVLGGENLTPGGRRAVAVIERQLNHLTRLVDDLLDVSRITSGKIELRMEPTTLASVVKVAVEAASPAIIAGGHHLALDVSDTPVWVVGDAARLAQVVTNLLNNSAKYTPPGGRITVTAGRDGDQAVVRVVDTGVGIPHDAMPGVFEIFRQVNRPDTVQGGLGIGLALVKRLVEMHGGSVDARSAGPGRGAEFVVSLPAWNAALNGRDGGMGRASLPAGGRRLRVLVVDDNLDLVEMLAVVISTLGHEVRKADDGPSALANARTFRPDVVLLDLGLPGMSGIEVGRELRRLPETEKVLLVALTGRGQEEDRRQTTGAGFDRHLTKPTDPDTLEQLLAEYAAETAVPSAKHHAAGQQQGLPLG